MASGVAVLGVNRAARPAFRSAHDCVAFAVHASFLAEGYSLTAVGPTAASSSPSGSPSDSEVEIEGWNGLEDAYAFQYSGGNQPGLCKSLIVKCTAMDDLLMVDAAPLSDADTLTNLEIKVLDYAVNSMESNYGEHYSDLGGLVERINSSLISKVSPSVPAASSEPTRASSPWRDAGVGGDPRLPWGPELEKIFGEPLPPWPPLPPFPWLDPLEPTPTWFEPRHPRRDTGVGGGPIVGPGDPRLPWGPQPGTVPWPLPPFPWLDPRGPTPAWFEPRHY